MKVSYSNIEKYRDHKKYTMCIIGYLLGRIKRLYPDHRILNKVKSIQNQLIIQELRNDMILTKEDFITIGEAVDKEVIERIIIYLNKELNSCNGNKLKYKYIVTYYLLRTIKKIENTNNTLVNKDTVAEIEYFYKNGISKCYSHDKLKDVFKKLTNKHYVKNNYNGRYTDKFMAKIEMNLTKRDYYKLIYLLEFIKSKLCKNVSANDIDSTEELLKEIPVLLEDYDLLNIEYDKELKLYLKEELYNIVKKYYNKCNLSKNEKEYLIARFSNHLVYINETINPQTEEEIARLNEIIHNRLNNKNIFKILNDKIIATISNILKI